MTEQTVLLLMHDICPFRIGSRVTVSPTNKYASEWTGNYAVVMIEWKYRDGRGHGINIGIASDDEIASRSGYTDGFSPDDLLPAQSTHGESHKSEGST